MAGNPQEWWAGLPLLTKVWLGSAVFTGVGAKLGWMSRGMLLVHDWDLILHRREVWRLATPFAFFGLPSFGWLMQMWMMSNFLPAYERDPYPSGGGFHTGNAADVLCMLAFGAAALLAATCAVPMPVLGPPLFTMVIYVWSRRNPEAPTNFFMFRVPASYLPWVMVGFAFVVGQDPLPDLCGIAAGHAYYFLNEVLPTLDGPFKGRRLLTTPRWLYNALSLAPTYAPAAQVRAEERRGGGAPGGPAAPPGFHAFGGAGRRLG